MKYQIKLVCVSDKQQFWVSKNGGLTLNYKNAFGTPDLSRVSKYVKRYNKSFKVIVVDENGEVIQIHERICDICKSN